MKPKEAQTITQLINYILSASFAFNWIVFIEFLSQETSELFTFPICFKFLHENKLYSLQT